MQIKTITVGRYYQVDKYKLAKVLTYSSRYYLINFSKRAVPHL